MAPASPTITKRVDPRNTAAFLLTMVLAAVLCYQSLRPTGSAASSPNHIRVRFNMGSRSMVDAEGSGSEEQIKAAVRLLGPEPTGEEGPKLAGQQQQQSGAEEEEADAAARKPQAEQQAVQQQAQTAKQQQQEAQLPPAKSGEQRFAEFAAAVKPCYEEGGLDCLTKQADLEPGPGQFRFPHFFVVGFQKCATTSLFHHLAAHPQIEEPDNKEPEFFTNQCDFNAMRCTMAQQRDYMREILRFRRAQSKNFTTAGFEGSTHYVLEGKWLAGQLRDLFPWLRIVVSMREPISQAIAMLNHNLEHKRSPYCYRSTGNQIFQCISQDLDAESRYAPSLRPWLKHFPREQLHLVQYENMTSDDGMRPALRDIKGFLAIKPKLPSEDLGLFNYRHQRTSAPGWHMTRQEYVQLVEKARRNGREVVEIVRQHGFADAEKWMQNWEDAWQANLDKNCDPKPSGACTVRVT